MSAGARRAPRTAADRPTRPAHSVGTHVRATVLLLVLTVLLTGTAYPVAVTEIAHLIDPASADGSLLTGPGGVLVGSRYVAQNLSVPYLFWPRPSLSDYNTTLGALGPPGPSDPALAALLNETLSYIRLYGNSSVNASVPLEFAAPSASSVDPDITPPAALIQVPRVAAAAHLSIDALTALVNRHIVQPPAPGVGVPYVNVLALDLDLLSLEGR